MTRTAHGPAAGTRSRTWAGWLLVLGDNLARSKDSRLLGCIPDTDLLGVVLRPIGQG
ncbi:S26 family signal peptidase [Lentzea guizhouensis]|uniref:S26 family signal peptidase n=1 Tax=Lentzea guizhouensis TaxID=1586287 RepID=UPI0012B6A252|nr:S26 family signal peptidase [Lentzea guizhouensis]